MPKPEVCQPAVMVNLIGTDVNPQWLSLPLVHLHWYEKEVRPVRKVGHLNLVHCDSQPLKETLKSLSSMLDDTYQYPIKWALEKLS